MEKTTVKNWYVQEFPTDELGCELNEKITFIELFSAVKNYKDVYDVLGVYDSLVRERVFGKLSEIMNVEYSYVYDLWLNAN